MSKARACKRQPARVLLDKWREVKLFNPRTKKVETWSERRLYLEAMDGRSGWWFGVSGELVDV